MRSIQLATLLQKNETSFAINLLRRVCKGCWQGDQKSKEILLAFLNRKIVFPILGLEKIEGYFRLAREMEADYTARLFLDLKPFRIHREDGGLNQVTGEDLTLGEKKSLARSPHRAVIKSLLFDESSAVIHILLKNPKLTETDVLKIASKRPVKEAILSEVFLTQKWLNRYEVKKALIYNPYTSPHISLGLIHFIKLQDLVSMSSQNVFHPILKAAITELIRKKQEINHPFL